MRNHVSFSKAALIFVLPIICTLTYAQEPGTPSVEDALKRATQVLSQDPNLAPETREALVGLLNALANERNLPQPSTATLVPADKEAITDIVDERISVHEESREKSRWDSIGERLDFYSDLRLRYESDFDLDTRSDRNRGRIRFRAGANYQVADQVQLGVRLITGNSDDPQSPHQTLGTVFNSIEVSLDRVFLTYRPQRFSTTAFTAGKFAHPFYTNPVYGELVWDADVQPEGVVIGYQRQGDGRLERLDIALGEYILLEQGRAEDAYMTVAQIATRLRLTDHLKANIAAGYYFYSDVSPDGSAVIFLRDDAGNAYTDINLDGTAENYLSDFGILNPIIALTYDGWRLPLTISGEYIKNLRANIDADEGWALGLSLGNAKMKGDWQLYYQYQVVEQDAVFTAVAQDDFLFSSNHRSHVFGFKYGLTDRIGLHTWGLVSRRDEILRPFIGQTTDDQWRVRLDLNIKL